MTHRGPTDEREALSSALAGHYEIEHEIGRGGMATVYLARDSRHDRRVAVKVLNRDLGVVLGVERFLSEIRVTANLQHPNVLPLFDSGEADGLLYYVMPFVDGESLRAKLAREKQLPVDEALRIAVAIANAAEYAHAHGVVHRDLKPENILLQSGQPIVADFGIALAVSNAGGARVTQTGMSLGTPSYMSPEQATGDRQIDARSDVYAIGAMTYEMLVGEPPHTGSSSQAVIARVLTDRPRPVRESRASVPEHVDAAVLRALEKLPADRFSTAKEFADALQDRNTFQRSVVSTPSARRGRNTIPLIAAGVAALAALGAGVGWWRATHVPPPAAHRFTISPPAGLQMAFASSGRPLALSPDGQLLAFLAGPNRLFIRRLDQLDATPFPKAHPIGSGLNFSPDSKWLVYADGGPTKISTSVGEADAEPMKLWPANTWHENAWASSNLVVTLVGDAFMRVSSDGGKPVEFARRDTMVDGRWYRPTVLPDGKTIAFRVTPRGRTPSTKADRLALISIDGGPRTVLDLEFQAVVGCVDGILIFSRVGGRLWGVRLDVGRRKLLGEAVPLIDNVAAREEIPMAMMSEDGTLAYFATAPPSSTLQIVDQHGAVGWELSEPRAYSHTSVSPDGKHIAMDIEEKNQSDIWIYDVEARTLRKITQTGAYAPAWTPDGKHLAFVSTAMSPDGLNGNALWVAADGGSAPEPIPGTAAFGPTVQQVVFSPDGKYAIVLPGIVPGRTPYDRQLAVPLAGGPPIPILQDGGDVANVAVSPNGKWIAVESWIATRQYDVSVRPFPTGPGKLQVSADGGGAPQWSPDGKTLFYRHESQFRSVTLDISGAMPRITHSDTLFSGRDAAGRAVLSYGVHPDGKRFVVTRDASEGRKLVIVEHWMTEVRQKLAGK